ncbi:MAG TPA: polyphosphate kinase 1 [Gemmatimonadales bacterium]
MSRRIKPRYTADCYFNREVSWLAFNERVLDEAADPSNLLLERLKFLAIVSSNLDEFFEIRVAGLQQQLSAGLEPQDYGADGLGPAEVLEAIERRTHDLVDRQYAVLRHEILPGLAACGIERVRYDDLSLSERRYADRLYHAEVHPVMTPLAIDPGHPFPHVHNKSLNILLRISRPHGDDGPQEFFAVVQVPGVLDRIVILPHDGPGIRFLLLEDLICAHLETLFGGFAVLDHTIFRVTRNTDLAIDEDDADDLLLTIEESLRQRIRGEAVRIGVSADAGESFVAMLQEALDVRPREVYRIDGPVDLTSMMQLYRVDGFRELRDEPLVPRVPAPFAAAENIFDLIRGQDILVHHPYESFGVVVDFIEAAAADPNVLAIKQTLYRTSVPSPIINALARAAQNGKEVTALVELKARFDERNNIVWARSLEDAGVHVVYGVVGLKTHCKAALVVRRESGVLRRYVHLSTGNYNPITARVYTDLGLFTADQAFGDDTTQLFNLLTGYSQSHEWRKLVLAPTVMLERVIGLIGRERRHALAGRSARIVVKMNALVEPSVIDALYGASQAGVKIDLLLRGISCLRPGVPGMSENIRVTSVVDRFLEHSRIFYFENAGEPDVFLGSADWMPRNFFRRIEVMFPIADPRLRRRIVEEILPVALAENVKGRVLGSDGADVRPGRRGDEVAFRSQQVFQEIARDAIRDDHAAPRTFTPLVRPADAAAAASRQSA